MQLSNQGWIKPLLRFSLMAFAALALLGLPALADTGSRDSAMFPLDTRVPSGTGSGDSGVFILNTRGNEGMDGCGGSDIFPLDTRDPSLTTPIVLHGRVTDTNGIGLVGVTVSAAVGGGLVVAQATTDAHGFYQLPPLSSAACVLVVATPGYGGAARALTLSAATALENFQLSTLAAAPTVRQTNSQPSAAYTPAPPGPMGSKLLVFDGNQFVPITAETSPSRNLMTIVMTHGWVPGTPDPAILNTPFDRWPTNMASQMRANGISAAIANILAWDWRYAAGDASLPPSHAADQVFSQGLGLGQALTNVLGTNYSSNLHFIGHSLGTLVNASAINYLHGDRAGNARQETSPTPWRNAPIHVTLLDQASIAQAAGEALLQNGFDSTVLNAFNQTEIPPWQSPLPLQFTWADNYMSSAVSFRTLSKAVNVRLQNNPGGWLGPVAAHKYAIDWYGMSIEDPLDILNPLGFSQSYESDLSIGLPATVFPPSTFQDGALFSQTPSSDDPLALELDFTLPQTCGILAEATIQVGTGMITTMGNALVSVGNVAQSAGQSILNGFDMALNLAQQGGQTVANLFNSGVLQIQLTTLPFSLEPQNSMARLQTLNSANSTSTAAMAWLPIQIPTNTLAMAFDFSVSGDTVEDLIVCGIDNTNLFSLSAKNVTTNTVSSSRLLDVSSWQGQQVELFFGLMGGTSSNATLQIDNIRFYSFQPPVANFVSTPTNASCALIVDFIDASSGTITNWHWDFGDGTTTDMVGTSVAHTYAAPGTNAVTLIVSGPTGSGANTQLVVTTWTAYQTWQMQCFGSITDPLSAHEADPDGDGMNNSQEYVAGTDPRNVNSVFRFTSAENALSQGIVVRWPSISNRFYNLSRATNLIAGTNSFIILPGASNILATPTENSYTDAVQGAGPYFYRIEVHE